MEEKEDSVPTVVIVGRPNVGKSTLFNRLVRRRLAITSPISGTTRDGATDMADFNGKCAMLLDTGGYRLGGRDDSEAIIDKEVRMRALHQAAESDVILLVVEAGDRTAEDEELIKNLRPFMEKTILLVNKTEGGRQLSAAYEWASMGFGTMLFISAEHGDNIDDLRLEVAKHLSEAAHKTMPPFAEEDAASSKITLSIVGRPNVGKSTLLNRLTHSNLSIVSDAAGTTRDVVTGTFIADGILFVVTDTAGIRKKSRVSQDIEYYAVNRAIKTIGECDIAIVMIDSNEGIREQDKKICDRAMDAMRAVIFVLSKWDTHSGGRSAARQAVKSVREAFPQMAYAPVVLLSAMQGTGLTELIRTVRQVKEQLDRRVETSALNIALHDWVSFRPPPATNGGAFKPLYMTQISTNPVKFVLFARGAKNAPKTYLTYLTNSIRRDLGFDMTNVSLAVRESSKKRVYDEL